LLAKGKASAGAGAFLLSLLPLATFLLVPAFESIFPAEHPNLFPVPGIFINILAEDI
jgi:hypothetical protein